MFQKIMGKLFPKKRADSSLGDHYAAQAALAREVCDLLSLARKCDFPVRCTVAVNGVECSFVVRDCKDVFCEGLYNYCASAALHFDTWREELAEKGRSGKLPEIGTWRERGPQIDQEGP